MTNRPYYTRWMVVWGYCLVLLLGLVGQLQAVAQLEADQPPTESSLLAPAPGPEALSPEAAKPRYVKGQLIVKYKDSVTECVHCLLKSKKAFKHATSDSSDSLDQLHAKHQVKSAKAVFRTELEEEQLRGAKTQAALKKYHAEKLERVRQKFPERTKRAPHDAKLPDLNHVYLLEVPEGTNIEAAVTEFAQDPHVAYAQPNYLAEALFIPNDPYYSFAGSWGQPYDDLWGLKKIQAEPAWDLSQGEGIVVAVVDTGLDYTHPDIARNVWVNPGEDLNGNRSVDGSDFNDLDDDNNGFVDDVWGWRFAHEESNPAISGNKVVFEDWRNNNLDIYLYNVTTGEQRAIVTHQADQTRPAIDGNKIVWEDSRNGNSDIYLYDLASGTEQQITSHGANQQSPVISGERVVWLDYRRALGDIYLYDLSTGAERRITADTTLAPSSPVISGDKVIWQDMRNGTSDLYLYDLATETERRITNAPAVVQTPAIDGDTIVWADSRNGNWDIYLYDLTTNTERQITTDSADQKFPAIDGTRIIWQDHRSGWSDIYLYDLASGSERLIAAGSKYAIAGDIIAWVNSSVLGAQRIYLYDVSKDAEHVMLSGNGSPIDSRGHGTHVAGTIAAVGDNGLGIIGVAPQAKIMTVRAFPDQGSAEASDLAAALKYAADNGADVINNSWGCGLCPSVPVFEEAVQHAHGLGAVIVFSAGNSDDDISIRSPQNQPETIVVSAFDHADQKANFSSFGWKLDVAAPGGDSAPPGAGPPYEFINILSLRAIDTDLYCNPDRPETCGTMIVDDHYYRARGTSMAAPHVAGLAALLLSRHPEFTNEDVRQALRVTAEDVGTPGPDGMAGAGRINAAEALATDSVLRVNLTAPITGTDLSGLDAVEIRGTASGPGFISYQLSYGTGFAPTEWVPIGSPSFTPVQQGTLGTWELGSLKTGTNVLKLSASNRDGEIFNSIVSVGIERGLTQITTNTKPQTAPHIDRNLIVWSDSRNSDTGFICGDKSTNCDIYLFDLSTATERQITDDPAIQMCPRISGERIVWKDARNGRWDIYLYDLATRTERRITTEAAVLSDFNGCPKIDGNRLTWDDLRNGNRDVYVYDLTTNTERRITSDSAHQAFPLIDGDTLVWTAYEETDLVTDLYVYDLSTGTERLIPTAGVATYATGLSGNRIVWYDNRNGNWDVFLYDLTTGTERQITTGPKDKKFPHIDGDRIVWNTMVSSGLIPEDISYYDLATNTEYQLTSNPRYQFRPFISGDKVVWQDYRNGNWDIYLYEIAQPPILDPIGNKTVTEDELLAFTVSASDPDEDLLTFQAAPLPSGASFVPLGDVTLNGDLDGTDAMFLMQYLAGERALSPAQLAVADVDENGLIEQADADLILEVETGLHLPLNKYRFVWTPTYDQAGTYEVTFTVSDGILTDSETITITVTDVNRPPTLSLIGNKTVDERQLLAFTVSASDPEGTALTFTAGPLPGQTCTPSGCPILEGQSCWSGPTFVPLGNNQYRFTWRPSSYVLGAFPNFLNSVTFPITFSVSDGVASASESITITVLRVPAPTITLSVSPTTIEAGSPFTVTISGASRAGLASVWWWVQDVNDPSWHPIPGTVNGVRLTNTYGLAAAQGFGACYGQTSCSYSRTVTIDNAGTYKIGVNARDLLYADCHPHQASEGSGILSVQVENLPPVLAPLSNQTTAEGSTLTMTVSGSDPNGDAVSLSMESTTTTAATGRELLLDRRLAGLLEPEPLSWSRRALAWLLGEEAFATMTYAPPAPSFSDAGNGTGTFSWSPSYLQAGTYTVTFAISDGKLTSAQTITITVQEVTDPPVAHAGADQTVDSCRVVSLDGSGSSDPDGDPLTYQWIQTAGPAVTLSDPSSVKPTFSSPWVSAVTNLQFLLRVSDGRATATDSVTSSVNPPPGNAFGWVIGKGACPARE